jgi:RNA recognition motif-containing protein
MSAHKVYVGNLPFNFTKVDLQELFGGFGPVRSAEVITDRETGRSRGFGFVEMETAEALQQAIAGLHERSVQGRNLTVNEARERVPGSGPRPGGGAGGFRPSPGARPFGGGGGAGPARPAWSTESKPRFDKGGSKQRGGGGRGDERESGRGRRGRGWGGDEG